MYNEVIISTVKIIFEYFNDFFVQSRIMAYKYRIPIPNIIKYFKTLINKHRFSFFHFIPGIIFFPVLVKANIKTQKLDTTQNIMCLCSHAAQVYKFYFIHFCVYVWASAAAIYLPSFTIPMPLSMQKVPIFSHFFCVSSKQCEASK